VGGEGRKGRGVRVGLGVSRRERKESERGRGEGREKRCAEGEKGTRNEPAALRELLFGELFEFTRFCGDTSVSYDIYGHYGENSGGGDSQNGDTSIPVLNSGTSPSFGFQKFSRWYSAHCGVSLFWILGLLGSDISNVSEYWVFSSR